MSRPNETPPPSTDGQKSIGELFSGVSSQMSSLVRGEIKLAQANLSDKVGKMGLGGALLAAAGVLGMYLLSMLLFAAAFGLGNVVPLWAAFLIVAGILLVLIAILVMVGVKALKKSGAIKIDPVGGLKKDIAAAKEGLGK